MTLSGKSCPNCPLALRDWFTSGHMHIQGSLAGILTSPEIQSWLWPAGHVGDIFGPKVSSLLLHRLTLDIWATWKSTRKAQCVSVMWCATSKELKVLCAWQVQFFMLKSKFSSSQLSGWMLWRLYCEAVNNFCVSLWISASTAIAAHLNHNNHCSTLVTSSLPHLSISNASNFPVSPQRGVYVGVPPLLREQWEKN